MEASATNHHCPFLNRADRRCAEHFNLDHLRHTFTYCFDSYKACPHYLEMLVERQVKRVSGGAVKVERAAGTMKIGTENAGHTIVQISLPRRYAQSAA
jgi:hypothetical protein